MHWSETFYARQAEMLGTYTTAIHCFTSALAARVTAHLGGPQLKSGGRILELSSGRGQFAVAAALSGHDVCQMQGSTFRLDVAGRNGALRGRCRRGETE